MQISEKQAIADKIFSQIGDNRKYSSQAEAAKALQISPATLTQIKKGELSTLSEAVWLQLGKALGMYNQITKGWQVVETQNYKRFLRACEDARQHALFNGIIAPTGMGKTTALKAYAELPSIRNVFYVWCTTMQTVKHLIQAIAEAMGISTDKVTAKDLYQEVVKKLCSLKNSLLILDSAHRLEKTLTMQFIGDLAEAIEGRAGLVIAGTPELKQKIEFAKSKGKTGMAEMERRIFSWTTGIAKTDKQHLLDARRIAEANGIEPDNVSDVLGAGDSVEHYAQLYKAVRKRLIMG